MTSTAPILLFGGTFDPPQRAHIELPLLVARQLDAERVIFIPAAGNPLKAAPPAPAADRLAMLRLALEGATKDRPAEISTIELDRPPPSYTVDTLRGIARGPASGRPLLLLMGADAALSFPRWREPEAILALATPVVLLRPPHRCETFAEELARVHPPRGVSWWLDRVIDAPSVEASSSEVRRRIRAGEPIDDIVDGRVAAYIRDQGLYAAQA
ncbi:MAG TPA: nicotinate (nicotinamide) nucleotide adenylyltransferase [Phycisphaerales bacterium]|nr:nicotinate (nicotinamide) nucleotide adenylyltransferase [Phycisphaerales bacterium]HMP38554.1 nicotinate (nicotinamide) nucleotide adenylyltransferase [Phycisphaerales bacterium]